VSTACVVGAGIAGIACARALAAAGVDVVVHERSRAVGGRMASRRVAGRVVDTGAQYFTAAGDSFRGVAGGWLERGLAREWTDTLDVYDGGTRQPSKSGPMRWAAPGGLRSLVRDLAEGLDVRLDGSVTDVGPGPTVDGAAYDAVVLAMPDPQALRLLHPALVDVREQLAGRDWEPQLALLTGFARRTWDLDAAFVNGDEVLSVVADDGARRGDLAPVLVAHSTVAFATRHLHDPAAATPSMVAALRGLLGLKEPDWALVHRWGFATPARPRDAPCWVGSDRVGLCGDGWGTPKVENAWASGDALGQLIAGQLIAGAHAVGGAASAGAGERGDGQGQRGRDDQ